MLTEDKIRDGLTPAWTAEDRLLAVAALLPAIQSDIGAHWYSIPGRPNITSLQHIIYESAEVLEAQDCRAFIEPFLNELRNHLPGKTQ